MRGAAVEQRRGRAHEVKTRQQVVELDGTALAIQLPQGQAHGDPHEKGLRHLNPTALAAEGVVAIDQEVAVIKGLQAQVIKVEIVLGFEGSGHALEVVPAEFLV